MDFLSISKVFAQHRLNNQNFSIFSWIASGWTQAGIVLITKHDAQVEGQWTTDHLKATQSSDHHSKCSAGIVPLGALQSGVHSVGAHLQQPQSGYQSTPGPSQTVQQGMTS